MRFSKDSNSITTVNNHNHHQQVNSWKSQMLDQLANAEPSKSSNGMMLQRLFILIFFFIYIASSVPLKSRLSFAISFFFQMQNMRELINQSKTVKSHFLIIRTDSLKSF